jgi:hypothetical protein
VDGNVEPATGLMMVGCAAKVGLGSTIKKRTSSPSVLAMLELMVVKAVSPQRFIFNQASLKLWRFVTRVKL